ncbi:hypothetical protein MD484_g1501, partial [Candolleomyces efflorescens]
MKNVFYTSIRVTQVPPHYIAHINNAAGGLHASLPSYGVGGSTSSSHTFTTATTSGSTSGTPTGATSSDPKKKSRKIGTQDRPLETSYYDILGVAPTSSTSTDDIKKAYRRLAIKHHPDKNPSDPTASARFTQIGVAYQTLVDPELRKRYNEFGAKESQPEGGYVDPEEVFGAIFGGERFVGIIGRIGLASDMKAAMQEDGEEEDELEGEGEGGKEQGDGKRIEGKEGVGKKREVSPEERRRREERRRVKEEKERVRAAEKAAARAERVGQLVENLTRKLSIFTESATGPTDPDVTRSWKTICELEAEDLKRESYGVELLQAIGFVYVAKAKHHLATHQTFFGVGGWLHNVQGKYHVFSETVSTLRSAIELKAVFDQIAAAEKAGGLSPEERKRLEEQAAEKGLQALFKGAKLEIESILREVCDRIFTEPNVSKTKLELRAVALQILGEAFMGVKKDASIEPMSPGFGVGASAGASAGAGGGYPGHSHGQNEDSEYVKIETKASKNRARQQYQQ